VPPACARLISTTCFCMVRCRHAGMMTAIPVLRPDRLRRKDKHFRNADPLAGAVASPFCPLVDQTVLSVQPHLPAQPVDATQALNLSAGVSNARSHVVVRLAGEPLCSDRLASVPIMVPFGKYCLRRPLVFAFDPRSATGFADRKSRRRCCRQRKAGDDP